MRFRSAAEKLDGLALLLPFVLGALAGCADCRIVLGVAVLPGCFCAFWDIASFLLSPGISFFLYLFSNLFNYFVVLSND